MAAATENDFILNQLNDLRVKFKKKIPEDRHMGEKNSTNQEQRALYAPNEQAPSHAIMHHTHVLTPFIPSFISTRYIFGRRQDKSLHTTAAFP
jgi:hypothetical protein